jgi:uncharacterized protein YlxW (UPF0749 family)
MRWVSDKLFIILLAFIALMLIVLSVTVYGYLIPQGERQSDKINVVCRAAEQMLDDRVASLKEQRRAIEAERKASGELSEANIIRLANNERSRDDLSPVDFIIDQECP